MSSTRGGPAEVSPSGYGQAFASVFDAHLAPDDTDAVLARLREALGSPPARALELGPGTGRLALPLSAAGYRVTGVESSPRMAAALRAKPGGDQVRLIMGDYGHAPFGGPYDLVFGVEFPLAQLHPRGRLVSCLRAAAKALVPGGRLIVDASVPAPELMSQTSVARNEPLRNGGRLITDFQHDPGDAVGWGAATVQTPAGATHTTKVVCSYIYPDQLDELAAAQGFSLDQRHRDWSGTPYNEQSQLFVSRYLLDQEIA